VLHKEIPFLRLGLPLCIGIISGLSFKPDPLFLLIISVIVVTSFAVSFFFNRQEENSIFGFAMTLSMFLCGSVMYHHEKSSLSVLRQEPSVFLCTISDYPEEKSKSLLLKAKIVSRINKYDREHVRGSLLIYTNKNLQTSSFLPGDKMIIRCSPSELVNRGNPFEFDYRFYMENLGIRYYAFTSGNDIIPVKVERRSLRHRALILRQEIINMYEERGITGDRLALVAAITLGEKSMLDREQKQSFIKAGVMHIMAVSGLHAVILSLFVFYILFFLKKRFDFLRITLTILFLWSFAFVTGLTPSVLRATLMFTFIQAGNIIKRKVNPVNSVLASAFVLILLKPSVIFDAGFLLSYSAVIFIISFYFDFYSLLQPAKLIIDRIWQSAAVTVVAQLGTLPLTIMLFNRFPVWFILTNIVIVPLASLIIITGSIAVILCPLKAVSGFICRLIDHLAGLTEFLTEKAASLPLSNIENIGMTVPQCFLLFMAIFTLCYYFLKRPLIPALLPFTITLIFVVAGTVNQIYVKTSNEIIVYSTPGSATIGVRAGKLLTIYSDSIGRKPEVMRHCASLGLKMEYRNIKNDFYVIKAGQKQILICKTLGKDIITASEPDVVIFTGTSSCIERNLNSEKLPIGLILTSVRSSADVSGRIPLTDTIHFVRRSGAFIMKI
jgi:competence protein ComEC